MIIECNVKSFYAFIDKEACTKILSNLLSNSIKYARSKIIVRFEAQDGERFTIDIMNDGKPISEEIKEKIFEPFYRDDSSIHKSGTGLGLPLARSLAEMNEGSLTLEESPAGLIIFRLRLPVNQPNSLKLEEEKAEVLTNPASERKYVTQESRPTVLVVEDNTEMLHFIGQEINVHYNVVTAGNGEEAIARLQEYGIQLIISDIMMPVMDGMELSRRVKSNFAISHIPFLMLTAKTSNESRIESFRIGVDEYLLKPFDDTLLLARISNILENRKRFQQKFSYSMDVDALNIEKESSDKKFLDKAMQIVKENYKNSYYEISDFIEAMGVSKSLMNKKMQNLTGQSAGQFMRNYRLNLARELIIRNRLTHNMNISEIAYEVGFNDPKYFTRCFTKHFGTTPSSMMENGTD